VKGDIRMNILKQLKELNEKEHCENWMVKQWSSYKDPVIYGGEPSPVDGIGKVAIATIFVTDYNDLSRANMIALSHNALPLLLELVEAGNDLATAVREWAMEENNTTINDCVVLAIHYQQKLAKLEGGAE